MIVVHSRFLVKTVTRHTLLHHIKRKKTNNTAQHYCTTPHSHNSPRNTTPRDNTRLTNGRVTKRATWNHTHSQEFIHVCLEDVTLCAIESPWKIIFFSSDGGLVAFLNTVVVGWLLWPSCWSLCFWVVTKISMYIFHVENHTFNMFSQFSGLLTLLPPPRPKAQQQQSSTGHPTAAVAVPQWNWLGENPAKQQSRQRDETQTMKQSKQQTTWNTLRVETNLQKVPSQNAFWDTRTPSCVFRIMTASGRLTHCRVLSANHVFLANPPKVIRNVSKIPTSSNISSFRCCDSSFFWGTQLMIQTNRMQIKKKVAWRGKKGRVPQCSKSTLSWQQERSKTLWWNDDRYFIVKCQNGQSITQSCVLLETWL